MFVVVSGLPGSGKTTLARPLSVALGLPLLDKDELLETLLDSLGAESPEQRGRSSRASDLLLQRQRGTGDEPGRGSGPRH